MSTKQLKEALKFVWGHGEPLSWPYKSVNLSADLLDKFYQDFKTALEEADRSKSCGTNSTCIFRTFDILIKAMKYHKKAENIDLAEKVITVVSRIKSGDIFNESSRNLIYGKERVDSFRLYGESYDPNQIHKLLILLKSYTELIYLRSYDISREIHGPYYSTDLGSNKLLVWDYSNLRPSELLPEKYLLHCNQIKFEILYSEKIDIQLDIYNHVYQKGANLKDNLISCNVFIDNHVAKTEDIKNLEQTLINSIYLLYKKRQNIADSDFIRIFISSLWYKLSLISNRKVPVQDVSELDLSQEYISENDKIVDYHILGLYF